MSALSGCNICIFLLLAIICCCIAHSGLGFAQSLTGECNVCLSNGVACLDERHFAICASGTPTSNRTPCPAGSVCTAETQICLRSSAGYRPVCFADNCGDCSLTNGRFACLDETGYGLCFGGATHDPEAIRYCPIGYVCNVASRQICASRLTDIPSCLSAVTTTTTPTETTTDTTTETTTESTTDTITGSTTETTAETTTESTTDTTTDGTTETTPEPTTKSTTEITTETTTDTTTEGTTDSTTEITTTTERTADTTTEATTTIATSPREPSTLCANMAREGNFKPDGDTTCTDYIHCYFLAGQYLGIRYICNGYFNAATGACQSQRPADC